MKRTLLIALAAGLATSTLAAQTAPATSSAPAVAVPPQALPAKVAIIAFEQAVVATNEGQRAVQEIQKKYEPQKAKIDSESSEIDSLKKQAQALPANAPDDERAKLSLDIDKREKQLQLDADSASSAYNEDLQKAYGTVAQKVGAAAVKFCTENGFTLLLNVGGNQQSPNPVLWFTQPSDVTQAVVNAYNTASGIAAPTPSAPSATRRPSTNAPHSTAPAHR